MGSFCAAQIARALQLFQIINRLISTLHITILSLQFGFYAALITAVQFDQMASSSQEVSKEPGPSNLRIVRVKRKRTLQAPADLGKLNSLSY
jgi:hypothetical protein